MEQKAQIQAWLDKHDIALRLTRASTSTEIDAETSRVAAKYHSAIAADHEEALRMEDSREYHKSLARSLR